MSAAYFRTKGPPKAYFRTKGPPKAYFRTKGPPKAYFRTKVPPKASILAPEYVSGQMGNVIVSSVICTGDRTSIGLAATSITFSVIYCCRQKIIVNLYFGTAVWTQIWPELLTSSPNGCDRALGAPGAPLES
jgi:hypothetical protein